MEERDLEQLQRMRFDDHRYNRRHDVSERNENHETSDVDVEETSVFYENNEQNVDDDTEDESEPESTDSEEMLRQNVSEPQELLKIKSPYSPKTTIKFDKKNIKTPLSVWSLLFSKNILEIIVKRTNEEIKRKITIPGITHQTKTNVVEIKAFLGLLYFIGLRKETRVPLDDLWSIRFGSHYDCIMSRNRFEFLLRCLCFDDKETRARRTEEHALAPIKDIWDSFIANCTKYYIPSKYCTIGRQFLEFHGQFEALVSIPMNNYKYGIQVICLNDADTSYMINAEPYVRPYAEDVLSNYIHKLSEPLHKQHDEKRNITCDNWFTSIEIVEKMKEEYLTMVGEIRKNKLPSEVPSEFKKASTNCHPKFRNLDDNILVSYYSLKEKKTIVLLSSLRIINQEEDEDANKSKINSLYDSTIKGGTETFNKRCKTYSTARTIKEWPVRLFFCMLDQAAVNATIIFNLDGYKLRRRDFLKELAFALIQPHIKSQLGSQLPIYVKCTIQEMLKEANSSEESVCYFCLPKNNKTNISCVSCTKPVCMEHRKMKRVNYCKSCIENIE